MRTILAAALIALSGSANAQLSETFYGDILLDFVAQELGDSCQAAVSPQIEYEDTVEATTCLRVAADYLALKGIHYLGNEKVFVQQRDCAVGIILANRSSGEKVVKLLDDKFDGACEQATM